MLQLSFLSSTGLSLISRCGVTIFTIDSVWSRMGSEFDQNLQTSWIESESCFQVSSSFRQAFLVLILTRPSIFRQPNAWFGIIISAVAIGQYQQWPITTFNTIQRQIVCFPVLSTSFAFIHAAVSPGCLFLPSYVVKQWSRQASHVYEQLVLVSVLSVCLWNRDTLIFLQLLSSTSAKCLGYTFSH